MSDFIATPLDENKSESDWSCNLDPLCIPVKDVLGWLTPTAKYVHVENIYDMPEHLKQHVDYIYKYYVGPSDWKLRYTNHESEIYQPADKIIADNLMESDVNRLIVTKFWDGKIAYAIDVNWKELPTGIHKEIPPKICELNLREVLDYFSPPIAFKIMNVPTSTLPEHRSDDTSIMYLS